MATPDNYPPSGQITQDPAGCPPTRRHPALPIRGLVLIGFVALLDNWRYGLGSRGAGAAFVHRALEEPGARLTSVLFEHERQPSLGMLT